MNPEIVLLYSLAVMLSVFAAVVSALGLYVVVVLLKEAWRKEEEDDNGN